MSEQVTTLRFKVPGPDSPGYLKRVRQALEFRQKLIGEPTPETIDELVKFLSGYVVEPQDEAGRIEALMEASQAEFGQLLEALTGENGANPTP
jgi:hypothetical protein